MSTEPGSVPDVEWFDLKSRLMVQTLGKEHSHVLHALVPYGAGGRLDGYLYPNGIPGTAVATKELCERPDDGPSNSVYRRYELVMFTRALLEPDAELDPQTRFGRSYESIARVINVIARFSAEATLEPGETCEIPAEDDSPARYLVFDGYACHSEGKADRFGLLLVIEVFENEVDWAREHGGRALLERLEAAGAWPYSDLDRESVV